jgi:NADH-quinone oxidoreductase subunit L
MIQVIVFLPLIGAILAGLISIFGAHARNPSGDTVEHHDDAHGTGAHASDARDDHAADGDGTTIMRSRRRDRAAELITTGLLLVAAALSWLAFWDVGFMHHSSFVASRQPHIPKRRRGF